MGKQVHTSAPWAIRCTPVHYGQSGVHQCTMGNKVYTSALWAFRCTPVHYGKSGVNQCTMGNQVYSVHPKQAGVHQCTIGNQVYTIWFNDSRFNVMFLTWWCSLFSSERGLTNGCGHSSIYCIQQSIWKIRMTCVYSDNFFKTHIVSWFTVGRGVASGQGWNFLVFSINF